MGVPGLKIPSFIQTSMVLERRSDGFYDNENGGQWVNGEAVTIPFKAAFMPVTSGDLQVAQAQGWDVYIEKKVYTNGFEINVGEHVIDSRGRRYLVTNELDHEYAGKVKIYFCKREGEAAQ